MDVMKRGKLYPWRNIPMSQKKILSTGKVAFFLIILVSVVTAAVTFAFRSSNAKIAPRPLTKTSPAGPVLEIDENTSKVNLAVSDMSCSGCIATIKGSLANIAGIKDVLVDLQGGKAEVYFDRNVLKDVKVVAEAITASGYPASVEGVLGAQQIREEKSLAEAKSKLYVASVGGWDVARADLDMELEAAKKRYAKTYGDNVFASPEGRALESSLKTQILSRLIDEGMIMQEVGKAGFKVGPATVDREFTELLGKSNLDLDAFKRQMNESGYGFDYFRKKFARRVLINKYLNEKILADATNELERQEALNAWYNNAKVLARVVYYDKDLQNLAQGQGASGSCCPVN